MEQKIIKGQNEGHRPQPTEKNFPQRRNDGFQPKTDNPNPPSHDSNIHKPPK